MPFGFTGGEKLAQKSETRSIFFFITLLCSLCAIILAGLSTFLGPAQSRAREEDEGKQMLIAAKILSYKGYFLINSSEEGQTNGKKNKGTSTKKPSEEHSVGDSVTKDFIPGVWDSQKNIIVPYTGDSKNIPKATGDQVLTVLANRVEPFLVDEEGKSYTFQEKNLNYKTYLHEHEKEGYAKLPLKLIYKIYANTSGDKTVTGYILPINGFGLWGPIYGYLAIESDGQTVIGTTWYNQGETAGLGAEIASEEWQADFYHKKIFQPKEDGSIDPKTSPVGIVVVKGTVAQVYGTSSKGDNAVDGISGATLTGKGVTNSYHDSIKPYIPFLSQQGAGNAK